VSEDNPHIYEFGEFRLDAARRLLLRRDDDRPVKLTSKAFDTLLYMVRHCGVVIEKDELMRAVWPDTIVEENNLNQNISALRRALGERQGENRYIATVPGRGFSFVAEVKALAGVQEPEGAGLPEPVASPTEVAPIYSPQLKRRAGGLIGRVWPAIFVGVIAAALSVGAFYLWRARPQTSATVPVRNIAVLPFKPLVPESRDEALELGMADTLIAKLSNIREIIVRPISSVRRYSGVEQDPIAAGRELGAEAVLDGTIQRWGDRIRVTARLLSVGDNRTLWAGSFDGAFGDIFAVQDSITDKVVGELAPRLTGEERERLTKRYTASTAAYELYLKGRFFMSLARPRKAIEFFEQAVGRDPNFALAYAGLADIYSRLPIAANVPSREAIPRAKEAALKALEFDDKLGEAYTALGWINFYYEWDWEGSEADHRRALEINPEDFSAHLGYAHLLSNMGRSEEALREVDQALRLDPLSPLANALKGQFLFYARRYPEAKEQLHKTLEINPTFWVALLQLGRSYEREGRYEEALEAYRKARESSGSTAPLSLIGYTSAASGRRDEAARTLLELRALSEKEYVPPYNVATIYNGLGNSDETLRWLARAYGGRDVHMVFLGIDPQWDALRNDLRFVRLMGRMNLTK
jgi:DNA-binding winged helix-turn-helix (wHTH) protein/TolB-like protein/Flp pilus assembly protein TadD